jgi:hypothetical protein
LRTTTCLLPCSCSRLLCRPMLSVNTAPGRAQQHRTNSAGEGSPKLQPIYLCGAVDMKQDAWRKADATACMLCSADTCPGWHPLPVCITTAVLGHVKHSGHLCSHTHQQQHDEKPNHKQSQP